MSYNYKHTERKRGRSRERIVKRDGGGKEGENGVGWETETTKWRTTEGGKYMNAIKLLSKNKLPYER